MILQKGGALPIIASLMATVFGLIAVKNLYRGLFAKITSNFFKKNVLIEQAKLNRFQQRQVREHSPDLQAMVRLLNKMRDITANRNLLLRGYYNYFRLANLIR